MIKLILGKERWSTQVHLAGSEYNQSWNLRIFKSETKSLIDHCGHEEGREEG